jgi:hypothetical protein
MIRPGTAETAADYQGYPNRNMLSIVLVRRHILYFSIIGSVTLLTHCPQSLGSNLDPGGLQKLSIYSNGSSD